MACAGVVASAGAQLDFLTLIPKSYSFSCGKGCTVVSYGVTANHTGSSMSPTGITMKDRTTHTLETVESSPYQIFQLRFDTLPSSPDNANTFSSLMLGTLRIDGDVSASNTSFAASGDDVLFTKTSYADIEYCSAIKNDNIFGFQFHPEKSGVAGLKIYENFKNLIKERK